MSYPNYDVSVYDHPALAIGDEWFNDSYVTKYQYFRKIGQAVRIGDGLTVPMLAQAISMSIENFILEVNRRGVVKYEPKFEIRDESFMLNYPEPYYTLYMTAYVAPHALADTADWRADARYERSDWKSKFNTLEGRLNRAIDVAFTEAQWGIEETSSIFDDMLRAREQLAPEERSLAAKISPNNYHPYIDLALLHPRDYTEVTVVKLLQDLQKGS